MTAQGGIRAFAAIVATAALVLAACDGGGGSEEVIAEYCEAVEELEARGAEIFSSVDQDDPAAIRAAEGEIADAIEEVGLVDKAPDEIQDDVETYSSGFRARARGDEGEQEAIAAAEEGVLAFEEENCGN